jgi:hypothetical protein
MRPSWRAERDTGAVALRVCRRYAGGMKRIGLGRAGALSLAAALLAATPVAKAAAPKKPSPAASAPSVGVSTTESLGTSGPWSAYASRDKAGRVCYLVGQPEKSDSAGIPRKAPSAMVTHRPAENISNVVSFVEGYSLKEGSEVALEIGDKKFELFTKDDGAWARTAELDRTIVGTLAHGKSAVVKGTPQKGRATTDVYSLAGFAKALALIDKACGVKREDTAAPAVKPASGKARPKKRTKRRPANG